MTREERERRVRELYVPGEFGHRRIAKELGLPVTTVRAILDPTFRARSNESSRLAKQRRRGICARCGGPTRYSGTAGGNGVSRLCAACNIHVNLNGPEAIARRTKYTDEFLLDEIRRWAEIHGNFPTAHDWSQGDREWPSARAVHHHFGTWNAGIAAAGFTPRREGVMAQKHPDRPAGAPMPSG